jgi:hypothetical protein
MIANITILDLVGTALAFILFITVYLAPGYLVGMTFNIFEFNTRSNITKNLIGIVLSNAIFPIFAYLTWKYFLASLVVTTALLCGSVWAGINVYTIIKNQQLPRISDNHTGQYQRFAMLIAGIWIIFSILLIVDIQVGNSEYFATVAYDYTTRISVIAAITKTGVPPINPGYYPGLSSPLTFLYYYWYILPSIVDIIGGTLINARQAMFAAVAWTGIITMAVIALYLRIRQPGYEKNNWQKPLIGVQLLLVSGVDFVPVIILSIQSYIYIGSLFWNGMIEGWNMPVMSWLNALTWVPNHVAAAGACITAILIMLWARPKNISTKVTATILAGCAFASSFGTSVWVTLTLAIAWIVWAIVIFFIEKADRSIIWYMAISGCIGLALSSPYIAGLVSPGNSVGGGNFPISFYIRPLGLVSVLTNTLPIWMQNVVQLLILPVNYFLELGFFFILAIYWLENYKKHNQQARAFYVAEITLLTTVVVLLSFLRSSVIPINDWGIRGWLLGQFVLLFWATDLLALWLREGFPNMRNVFSSILHQRQSGRLILTLLIIGILTTALEAFATRAWSPMIDANITGFPNDLSPDTNLGKRTYAARLAYEFINNSLPQNIIIQYNPHIILDRPSGLYGTSQMVISDRVAYGVSNKEFQRLIDQIGPIFENQQSTDWNVIDITCKQSSINVIVVNDTDPIWLNIPMLEQQRIPLYKNQYYAVFGCGDFASFSVRP